ncbi:hypothetical protein SFUL_6786 [Streptomyces microflavus DSM 40593]|uniref:Uncharacterized protein n=1 Tax=Streptomyces microflavus DSM 40593 TaxID=1303692 RepID=N0D669_STRMI|nr:hypothetical protein [Streptomyces microflavus]AGK81663.1 hypothetical protein SFUL_6786 [Streptomyces microflavus DSM 40593]
MDDSFRVDRDAAPDHYGRLRVRADGLGPAAWLTGRTEAEGGFGRVAGSPPPASPRTPASCTLRRWTGGR